MYLFKKTFAFKWVVPRKLVSVRNFLRCNVLLYRNQVTVSMECHSRLIFMQYIKEFRKPTLLSFLILFVIIIVLFLKKVPIHSEQTMSVSKVLHVEFEVFGRVQGVFFRKYTQEKARSLGIRGWIRNTEKRTVQGELEGDTGMIETMKNWLRREGSPSSRIDQAIFKNEREIEEYSFAKFSIKH